VTHRLPLLQSILFLGLLSACSVLGSDKSDAPQQSSDKGYAKVVPSNAETDEGMFKVHRVDEKLLFEIPNELLGRDMLLVSRIARVPADLSGGFIAAGHKAGEQVVRWERMRDSILLRKISFRNFADEDEPIYQSVTNNNFYPILAAFDVAAEGPQDAAKDAKSSVVIDVTDLFAKDTAAISGLSSSTRESYKIKSLDAKRSFINYAHAYPKNVDVRHTLTFSASAPPVDANTRTVSLEMHQSMVLLPKEPMRPRFADDRVGWFTLRRTNFGLDRQKADEEVFVRRWRLEPSDPEAYARGELVEPVQPIVYYLDPATPTKWRSFVKQGIEDWQAAFEVAGFKNAIIAKDAPTPEEDPEWAGEDVRYSMVRWAANNVRNAMGPSVSDPRSGEIIESDIVWFHNHMRSYRNRLMLETGAANPLARSLPIDEGLMGEAMRQVIAHEVGHALGLPHNMMASSSYPVESLRDPEFAREMGVSASIMDYARQNYVAQPGDGLEGADFIRQIGVYDNYAINWGYRVIPDADSPAAEKPTLHKWILEKADDPRYRFGARGGTDPRTQTEDLGDDPVRASTYGLANLKRVAPQLIEWTHKDGENYDDLDELYGELLGMFSRYTGHVVTVIGGVYQDLKTSDQVGHVYTTVPGEKQRAAFEFLAREVLATPTWLLDPEILRRVEGGGNMERVRYIQNRTLGQLLDAARLQRMVEAETLPADDRYSASELLEDVRTAVWGDVASADTSDPYRRILQRTHVERLEGLMTSSASGRGAVDLAAFDVRPLVRAQLHALRKDAKARADSEAAGVVKAHYQDISERITAFFARLASK